MVNGADSAVVFFSRDGNTRLGAEILCDRLGGKLVELKERKKGSALMALLRMKSQLAGDPWAEIAGARLVFLMLPIWAGNSVPAMNAFVRKADFTDVDVYIVTFQQSADLRLSYKVHQYIAGIVAANHGSARMCYALVGGKMGSRASEERIRSEIDKVKLPEEPEDEPVAVEEPEKPEEEPVEAVAEPVRPEEEPVEAVEEPERPEEEPAEVAEEPERPEDEPVEAVKEPEGQEEEPVEPAEEPVEAVEEPEGPEEEPVENAVEPEELPEEPAEAEPPEKETGTSQSGA